MKNVKKFLIFCDGGFGNRYNALISGLGIAEALKLPYQVYWPNNNWCQASFSEIFENNIQVKDTKISELAPELSNYHALLHDEIASKIINRTFNNVYGFNDIKEFEEKILNEELIFYYPAMIPKWIPDAQIAATIKSLKFKENIIEKALDFIKTELESKPYYGIHLRRTDLNIGYSDDEVEFICRSNKDKPFFVCSDDPVAEYLAKINKNVRIRNKS